MSPRAVALVSREGAFKKALDLARQRLIIAAFGFVLSYIVVGVRLVDVTMFDERAIRETESQQVTTAQFERSNIVDRNGALLATNLNTASLYANPKIIIDPQEAAKQLHEIFPEMSIPSLLEKLTGDKTFVWIKRNLTPNEMLAVNNLGTPGLNFHEQETRIYPQERALSHVLGYVDSDKIGLAGIERQFNKLLMSGNREPLKLSIDLRVQSLVYNELQRTMEEFKALGATGIVMDVDTGEVLAMVNLPDFDPHHPAKASDAGKFNRATLGVYEMGSTFKAFTTALALDSGIVKMRDLYDAREPLKLASFTIKDYHPKARILTVPEVFMYSSNIGTARMILDVGIKRQKEFLKKIGMFSPVPLELPERTAPLYPKVWKKISSMTIAYGHGIAVTPMHVVVSTAALVNGGLLRPASLLKMDSEKSVEGTRVIRESTSVQMRKLLRLVVEHGTGGKAAVPGYVVGGKTGTADKVSGKGYKRDARLSSFVSVFPMHAPKYVIMVMVDEPQGNASTGGYATGGVVAAPAVGRIIATMAPMMGVTPVDEKDPAIEEALHLDYELKEHRLASN